MPKTRTDCCARRIQPCSRQRNWAEANWRCYAEIGRVGGGPLQHRAGLRQALERGEFELLYQPEVDLATFDMGLVEALLRWRMPRRPPGEAGGVLAVAEQSGLIVDINAWVLRTAMPARRGRVAWRLLARCSSCGEYHPPDRSLDERFTDGLLDLLQEYRLPARCIELELTESVLQTGPNTIAALRSLQAHGIGIALDDFGTGYSSLTSLEQLPLSRIKLDRSLIVNIDSSPRSAAIATAILDLCAGLGLEVTVEGIERSEQFAWLLGKRQLYVQGYLISEPRPRDQIMQMKSSLAGRMQDLVLSTRSSRDEAASASMPTHDQRRWTSLARS